MGFVELPSEPSFLRLILLCWKRVSSFGGIRKLSLAQPQRNGASSRIADVGSGLDVGLVWVRNARRLGQYCLTRPADKIQKICHFESKVPNIPHPFFKFPDVKRQIALPLASALFL